MKTGSVNRLYVVRDTLYVLIPGLSVRTICYVVTDGKDPACHPELVSGPRRTFTLAWSAICM